MRANITETPMKPDWLVCKKCGIKEAVQRTTQFVNCQTCGGQRHGEDNEGNLIFFVFDPPDPDVWVAR